MGQMNDRYRQGRADPQDSLLEFPCEFPLKIMGLAADDFADVITAIVRRHAPELGAGDVTARHSRNGKYVSLTVTVTARDRAHIDGIYRELSRHERVMMML